MKKILFILLGLLNIVFPMSVAADESSGNPEDIYEFQYTYPAGTGANLTYTPLTNNTAQVIFHANYLNLEEVEIPEKVTDPAGKEYTVTAIGHIAFESCDILKSVKVPATVKEIKKYAFANSGVTEIILSEGLETIGDYAFENANIENLVLPKTVTRLEDYAFTNCGALKSVHIANPAIFIGPHCFEGSSMTSVTFGENTPEFQGKKGRISEWAFAHCEKLHAIDIPDNMPAIGSYAFAYCAKQSVPDLCYGNNLFNDKNTVYTDYIRGMIGMGLEHLNLGNGVTEIGDHAFYSCRLLGDIIIPNQVKTIGDYAFANCSLAHINRPSIWHVAQEKAKTSGSGMGFSDFCVLLSENTETIWFTDDVHAEYKEEKDDYEPAGYRKQVSPIKLQIGTGVTTIGAHAFENCRRLDEINIPDNVTSLGEYAFAGCYRYLDIACILQDFYTPCYGVRNISIGRGLTEIPAHAFENCKALETIEFPENIKKIGAYAFRGCSYAPFQNTAQFYPDSVAPNGGLRSITFGGVEEIGDYAFAECQSLDNVDIPDNVRTIGAYAFSDSRYTYWPILYLLGLEKEMEEFSKLNTNDLTEPLKKGLREITIGKGVTHIGEGAFARSKWLNKVTFAGNNVQSIGDGAFENCKSLKSISFPDCALGANLFNGSGVETLIIPPSCTKINAEDYLNCPYIKEINADGNQTYIVKNGFLMTKDGKTVVLAPKSITSVTIPAGTVEIAPYAFANCVDLTSVTFRDAKLTTVGDHAFDGCKKMTTLTLPASVTTIGDHAFNGCEKWTTSTLPASVTTIGDYAFNGCSNVKFANLPDSLKTIGDYAFAGCAAAVFKWFYRNIPQHIETIGEHAFDGCAKSNFGPFSDALKSIGAYAFKDCSNLNYITYGDYEFDDTSFEGCKNTSKTLYIGKNITGFIDFSRFDELDINYIDVDPGNMEYSSVEDESNSNFSYILSKDQSTLIHATGSGNVVIPENVTTIGAHAFENGTIYGGSTSGSSVVGSITIHNRVTTIDDYAFHNCSFSVIIGGEGVTTVGAHAFDECGIKGKINYLSAFGNLFDNLTTIGDYAFSNNPFFSTSTIGNILGANPELGTLDEFLRTYGAKVGKKVTTMGEGAFKGTRLADQELVIPATMTEVPDYAFADLSSNCCGNSCNLEKRTLKIEEGVKKIGAHSFANAFGLLQKIDGIKSANNAYTFSYTGEPYSFPVTLPQSIEEFGPAAFTGCAGFGAINIPRKVAELSDQLFMDCLNLESIDFSRAKITRIGKEALKGCSALKSVTLPNTLTVIDEGAFMNCTGLTEIVIPASVTKIGANAFMGCSNLQKITFPDKIIEIGDGAFKDCEALSDIVSPKSLEYLGAEAFANCKSLRPEIVLPDEVNLIGEHVFGGLTHLKKITFGKRVGTIGTGAFAGLTGLNQLSFNGFVGTIEAGAFTGCPITSLEFHGDIEAIGDGAFKNMKELTSVTFGKTVGAIGKEAFMNCSSLAQPLVLKGTKIVDDRAFSGCSKITSIDFGNDLTTIGSYAFNGCAAVDSIHFSATVIDIEDTAFEGCTGITKVSYDAEILNEFVEYLFPEIIYGYPDSTAENGTHVNHTTFYAPNATLVDAMMTAPWNRFYKLVCSDGEISHTTASSKIDDGGIGLEFGKLNDQYCEVVGTTDRGKDLTEITVPKTYTSKTGTYIVIQIGREAFKDHTNLEKIELPSTLLSIGTDAFKGCKALEQIDIPESVYRIGSNAFEGCWALTRMTIPRSVTEISDCAFMDCQGLLELKLHANLTAIGASAFENCIHLNEFLVPGEMTLTTIGARAFYNCNDLISVDFSESIDFIGESAFENCSKLDDVKLPASLKKIENKAFANCDRLTTIEIGDLVTEIGEEAFYDCERLNEIKIPEAVTKVGKGAFDLCAELTDIYLYSGDADLLGKQTFANPNCHIFVQRKDFDNYLESWEKNLYVAGQSDQDAIIPNRPIWWHAQEQIEFAQDTRPGDRIIAAITMTPEYMRLGDKSIIENNLPRYYSEATANFSTIAPVKHKHEYWSTNESRVAVAADTVGNFTIKGVGPGSLRVETENYYYHDYYMPVYPQRADANWDAAFDISDAVNIATHVVQNRKILCNWKDTEKGGWIKDLSEDVWEEFYLPGADVNGDGSISVSDASAAVKIVLEQTPVESSSSKIRAAYSNGEYDSDALVTGNLNENVIPVALDNSMEYVALQADIRVPEGMILEDVRAGSRAASHGLSKRRFDDRTMRVVLFDFNSSAFEESDEPILELVVKGEGEASDVELFGIVASDIESTSYKLSAKSGSIQTSVGTISYNECENVSLSPEGLLISNAKGKTIMVCTMDGVVRYSFVADSDSVELRLTKDIYVVTVGDQTLKIAIK